MKKKYEIGIKTHEFLLELYEKEKLHEEGFIFTYNDTPNDVEVAAGILIDGENDLWDVMYLYYIPRQYYEKLRKRLNIQDIDLSNSEELDYD